MIKYIQIENFKSLRKTGLPLSKLNLFFGMNAMGKSSVIQSLLLLRQSLWKNNQTGLDRLHINGDLIKLGTSSDIFCQSAYNEEIRFLLCGNNDAEIDCRYGYSSENMFMNTMELAMV